MFGWFDAHNAKEFGQSIALLFMQRMPLQTNWTQKGFEIKSRSAMKELEKKVVDFQIANSMNTYKTAQMANTFKWALLDAGYEAGYVDELTQWLVARMR